MTKQQPFIDDEIEAMLDAVEVADGDDWQIGMAGDSVVAIKAIIEWAQQAAEVVRPDLLKRKGLMKDLMIHQVKFINEEDEDGGPTGAVELRGLNDFNEEVSVWVIGAPQWLISGAADEKAIREMRGETL